MFVGTVKVREFSTSIDLDKSPCIESQGVVSHVDRTTLMVLVDSYGFAPDAHLRVITRVKLPECV
jgi:hypothetical protein